MKIIEKMVIVLLLAAASMPALAQDKAADTKGRKFTVAVLNFETKKAKSSLGEDVPNLLTAFLSEAKNLDLVERAEIKKLLEEMALGKTGIVKADEAAKIGQMSGAKFIITGRIFPVGKKLYITAKIMSTETSKVQVVAAKGLMSAELDELVIQLAEKVKTMFTTKGAAMLPKVKTKKDIIASIKKQLGKKKLPVFAVKVPEFHITRPVPDPAAETEITYILKACGAELRDAKGEGISEWAKEFLKDTGSKLPSTLDKTDIIIVGEGFSEYAGATGKLISCKARLELKAVSVKSGKILAIGRATATAVDLAESIAAKTALQKVAAEIAEKLIPQAVAAYEKEQAAKAGEK